MPERPLQILLVEDNPGDARLLRESLIEAGGGRFTIAAAETMAAAVEALRRGAVPDVVLLDLTLPDSQGLATVTGVLAAAPEVPLVVLTGQDDERLGLEALRAGAEDYLVKGQSPPRQLVRSIHYATERRRARSERERHLAQVDLLVRVSMEVMAERDVGGLLRRVAEAARDLVAAGCSAAVWEIEGGEVALVRSAEPGRPQPCLFASEGGRQGLDFQRLLAGRESFRLGPEELAREPSWFDPAAEPAASGLAGCRLVASDGRVGGLLVAADRVPGAFTSEDEALLKQLAALTSLALQHVGARTSAEGRTREALAARQALVFERDRLATILAAIPDGVAILDRGLTIEYMNPALAAELGDRTGRPCFEVFRGCSEPCSACPALQTFAGQTVRWEWTAPATGRTYELVDTPLRGAGGQVSILRIFRDVSQRKQAELVSVFLERVASALAASLEYRTTLPEVAALAVPLLGELCLIDEVGPGGDLRPVAAHPERPELEAPLRAAHTRVLLQLDGPPSAPNTVRVRRPELAPPASPNWRIVPFGDDLGAVSGGAGPAEAAVLSHLILPLESRGCTLGILSLAAGPGRRAYGAADLALAEDLARRLAVAIDNARLFHEAQTAIASKDQFLTVVSHELRNPLAAILAGTEILRRVTPEGDRARRAVEILDRNARLQARLVEDLLDVSRVARGKIPLQRAPVRLDEIARTAFQTHLPQAESAGLALRLEDAPCLWVLGDPDRLQQVLSNLLANALKFTPRGEIRIRLERRASDARLTVGDTGIGIEPALLGELFVMFRQGAVGGTGKSGLGIGLALVKTIVEKHEGRVWAESEGPGRGSRFVVELPLVAGPDGQMPIVPPMFRREIKLLLLEDNPDTCTLIAEGLGLLGHEVDVAHDGLKALEALARRRPDFILSDINLPGMDGYEFLRRVRLNPAWREIPAFAVTAYGSPEDVRRARDAGFAGHFVKPVAVAALDRHMREWLGSPAACPGIEEPS